jgi:hypothetical protein
MPTCKTSEVYNLSPFNRTTKQERKLAALPPPPTETRIAESRWPARWLAKVYNFPPSNKKRNGTMNVDRSPSQRENTLPHPFTVQVNSTHANTMWRKAKLICKHHTQVPNHRSPCRQSVKQEPWFVIISGEILPYTIMFVVPLLQHPTEPRTIAQWRMEVLNYVSLLTNCFKTTHMGYIH